MDDETEWERERTIVSAARSAFGASIRYALHAGLNLKIIPYLTKVENLAVDFESEPSHMGIEIATIWQDRAIELSNPVEQLDASSQLLISIAVQVAALVFHVAKRQGGERRGRAFGYGFTFARMTVEDRAQQLRAEDLGDSMFDLMDMLEFVYLRARRAGVPADVLASKRCRRGL